MASLLERKPRCECCSDLRQFIKRHLDPDDSIFNTEDPAEVVEGFDSASEDGNCGVTAVEMAEYMAGLPLRDWQLDSAD
jgi:hypothetical protein